MSLNDNARKVMLDSLQRNHPTLLWDELRSALMSFSQEEVSGGRRVLAWLITRLEEAPGREASDKAKMLSRIMDAH